MRGSPSRVRVPFAIAVRKANTGPRVRGVDVRGKEKGRAGQLCELRKHNGAMKFQGQGVSEAPRSMPDRETLNGSRAAR